MCVKLIVDNRENIKEILHDKIENVKFENLCIGDYCYKINDEDFLIIERKTIADYAASIRDGRNREQKKRLKSQPVPFIYLVEGNLTKDNSSFSYNKVTKDTIVSSILNSIMRDNIQVFHTYDINETIFFIESIYKKLDKQGKTFLKNKTNYTQDIIETVKINKKNNMNQNISFQMMMNCIPGISNKISSRLAEKFTNIKCFLETLDKIDEDKRISYIQQLKTDDTDKARKISIKVAQNILEFIGFNEFNNKLNDKSDYKLCNNQLGIKSE
tara:strand:+ start:556 stop:1368 length:813 start_codon:yes stop_codon:yes gene_type:complete